MSSSQKSNFSLVVYISRTKAKKNGEVPVLMKININGDRVVFKKVGEDMERLSTKIGSRLAMSF